MNFLNRIFVSGFFAAVIVFVSGCSLMNGQYRQVNYFDIGTADTSADTQFRVNVQPFINNSPSGYKFYYRYNNYKIVTDEYNKWTQTPDAMLTRYLSSYFSQDNKSSDNSYILSGALNVFEINMSLKKVSFSAEYDIKNHQGTTLKKAIFSDTQSISEDKPEAFAAAMAETVKHFAARVNEEISALNSRK